jgi:hypothetical protein
MKREELVSQTKTELKAEIQKSQELLRTLRDELRVTAHLAGMQAKEHWKALEQRASEVEDAAGEVTVASRDALSQVLGALRTFRDSLR